MQRLTVVCFVGTYALALAAELARLTLRAKVRVPVGVGIVALGLIVHTLYLVNRAQNLRSFPIATAFDSMIVLGWVLAAIALYLIALPARHGPSVAGLAVLALAVMIQTLAAVSRPQTSLHPDWRDAITFWGGIHGLFLVSGAVCTCLAFVFGLTYLAQTRRLKRKIGDDARFALPSLELSERWHRATITLAFPLLTAGIATGVALVIATRRSGLMILQWSDPKILSMLAVWMVFAVLLHARYRRDWRGRRVMLLTVVAFAFLAFAMVGVGWIFPSRHGGFTALHSARDALQASQAEGAP